MRTPQAWRRHSQTASHQLQSTQGRRQRTLVAGYWGVMEARALIARIVPMALALTAAMGAQPVPADEPPGPKLPISSSFTVGKNAAGEDVVIVCVKPNEDISGGPIHDVDFLESPWPDPLLQPKEKFKAPPGWDFEPVGTSGWRTSSSTPMAKGNQYCFDFPVKTFRKNPGNSVTLIATDKTHNVIANFVSTLKEKKESKGRFFFTLGQGPDRGRFLFRTRDCNRLSLQGQVSFQATRSGKLKITPAPPGRPARGRLFSNGTFAAGNATERWVGGIRGSRVLLEYRVVLGGTSAGRARTPQASCTATYIGRGKLARPGRAQRKIKHRHK